MKYNCVYKAIQWLTNNGYININGWGLLGNANTDKDINFIGTTDNNDVVFKRNNIFSGLISAGKTAFGSYSEINNTGQETTFFGATSGNANEGDHVVGIGLQSALNNKGQNSTFVGAFSGQQNEGDNVTSIGQTSLSGNTGDNVIAIGRLAGQNNTQNNRVIIGFNELPKFNNQTAANAALPASSANGVYLYWDLSDNTIKARL